MTRELTTRSPLILFAPGAGAPASSPWMRACAARLGRLGEVITFDYPYMRAGKKLPDRLPVLLDAHRAALVQARAAHGTDRPVVLAGKSMGSRVGCHLAVALATERTPIAALVCFGYPLRSPAGTMRDQVLRALTTPILFVQGTRDPLCPLEALAPVRAAMPAPTALHVVDGGDHSLAVQARLLRAHGRTQDVVDAEVLAAVETFLTSRELLS